MPATVDLIPAVLLGAIFAAAVTLPFALPIGANAHDLASCRAWLPQLGLP
jgi:hypothetical protein